MQSLTSCYTMGLQTDSSWGNVALKKQQLNNFLSGIEKRAFRMAVLVLGNRDDALDVVQEAMFQLVAKYHNKNEEEWPKLFFRILHNKAIDELRRKKRQRLFSRWTDNSSHEREDDIIDTIPAERASNPDISEESRQTLAHLERAIGKLPFRQQQAFMLRCWEGFNTAETAATMNCSEGSVKTHYSRALQALKNILGETYE